MLSLTFFSIAALSVGAVAQNTATSARAVHKAQATALTSSPTSDVVGKAFNRFVIIKLENTNYDLAATDPNLMALAAQGITLSKYYSVTHPSEPNYCASHGGDNFGMDNDNFNSVPANISSVVDLLEDKGISWGAYQEDMPYSGFEGYAWVNQKTGANDYVRKHNPPVIYAANNNKQRLSQIKNTTIFYEDLENNTLPQWMFITPNMTDDGHDTSVTVAGAWTNNFLTPLLTNPNFNNNTLVLITFDETETYTLENNVFSILIGDAVPADLVGTMDSNFYNHYSQIATVEANWDLHTLGRWDVGANVFSMVAAQTGDTVRTWVPSAHGVFYNGSYAGPFNSVNHSTGFPIPDVNAVYAGRTVLPAIVATWGGLPGKTIYNTSVKAPDGMHPPAGYAVSYDD